MVSLFRVAFALLLISRVRFFRAVSGWRKLDDRARRCFEVAALAAVAGWRVIYFARWRIATRTNRRHVGHVALIVTARQTCLMRDGKMRFRERRPMEPSSRIVTSDARIIRRERFSRYASLGATIFAHFCRAYQTRCLHRLYRQRKRGYIRELNYE